MFRLLAFVLPLGVDSFAVAAVLGAFGLTGVHERLRVSLIFVVFEAGMPLIGLAVGGGIARAIGSVADYLAGAAVIAIGIVMLAKRDNGEERKVGRITGTRGLAISAWASASAWPSSPSGSAWAWSGCRCSPSSWPPPSRLCWPASSGSPSDTGSASS